MDLTELSQGVQKRKPKKQVGRGIGSGHGKTASRGHKGQYTQAGANLPGPLFTGGQTPIHRRLPNRNYMLGVSAGWHMHLDVLVARARGEEPAPFWDGWLRLKQDYDRRLPPA